MTTAIDRLDPLTFGAEPQAQRTRSPVEDAALLRRAHEGDAGASRELLRRHAPRIHRIVLAAHGDRELARDVVQETFLRAIAQAEQLRADTGLFPWLVRIALRIAIDQKKKLRREILQERLPEPEVLIRTPAAERRLSEAEDAEAVQAALARLTPRWRELVVLRYFGGFTVAEIAQIADRSEVAVRKDLERARGRLRKLLANWFEVER